MKFRLALHCKRERSTTVCLPILSAISQKCGGLVWNTAMWKPVGLEKKRAFPPATASTLSVTSHSKGYLGSRQMEGGNKATSRSGVTQFADSRTIKSCTRRQVRLTANAEFRSLTLRGLKPTAIDIEPLRGSSGRLFFFFHYRLSSYC